MGQRQMISTHANAMASTQTIVMTNSAARPRLRSCRSLSFRRNAQTQAKIRFTTGIHKSKKIPVRRAVDKKDGVSVGDGTGSVADGTETACDGITGTGSCGI